MNVNATNFNPAWPASCPWVTAVGGTQVKANTSASDLSAEEVWNEEILPGFFESGGGGFSNRFPTPDYQKTAVKTFLDGLNKTNPTQLKNFNTRGVSRRY
jgi:tripeptidyl-peptidase I